jgi:hypothetical protein
VRACARASFATCKLAADDFTLGESATSLDFSGIR